MDLGFVQRTQGEILYFDMYPFIDVTVVTIVATVQTSGFLTKM